MNADPPQKILICDDDETLVDILETLFRGQGFAVVTAANGIECLERIEEETPDLLILDLDLPDMDGFQVLEELSGDGAARAPIVIVLSGLEQEEDSARALELGAKIFLSKPFTCGVLLQSVHALLGQNAPG